MRGRGDREHVEKDVAVNGERHQQPLILRISSSVKVKLTDEWEVIPEGEDSNYNFYRVTVKMR